MTKPKQPHAAAAGGTTPGSQSSATSSGEVISSSKTPAIVAREPPKSTPAEEAVAGGDQRPQPLRSHWHLTRIVFLRALGAVYFVAFLVALNQNKALIGPGGLTPADHHLRQAHHVLVGRPTGKSPGGTGLPYITSLDDAVRLLGNVPTLLWFTGASDAALDGVALAGMALSGIVVIAGGANSIAMATLWALYHSLDSVGGAWYSFGWESQLLETGFLAIFLVPMFTLSFAPLKGDSPPPTAILWLLRLVLFKIMLGAGLIKIRGDQCWRDLTCMQTFYETQPVPNPLAWWLHFLPAPLLLSAVAVNHFVELVAPFLLLMSRGPCAAGGIIQLFFQATIIIGGNLSFLNFLTMVPCLVCLDDDLWKHVFPASTVAAAEAVAAKPSHRKPCAFGGAIVVLVTLAVAVLSVPVFTNLVSQHQVMNSSWSPLKLVNTYGAFGSIGKVRTEVIVEGTADGVHWLPYEFPCKPGDVSRRPCTIAPYHYRMDWKMWFAAMMTYQQHPWLVHLVAKVLHGDPLAAQFFAVNPFPEPDKAPKAVRCLMYEYRFTPAALAAAVGLAHNATRPVVVKPSALTPSQRAAVPSVWGAHWLDAGRDYPVEVGLWWTRVLQGEYLPALEDNNPSVLQFLAGHGWSLRKPPARSQLPPPQTAREVAAAGDERARDL